jgi:hypothetical protein
MSRLRNKISLTNFYLQIICNILKLNIIKILFKKHLNTLSLIIFSFFKITFIVKCVS